MKRRFGSLDLQTTCVGEYQEPAASTRIAELTSNGPTIARGAGGSYVAASFGECVRTIGMRRLNRILSFDEEKKCITVEAGTTLGALYDFLVPQRLYLPIQPGHPQISVGGCVACNVHGKNPQRDGVFGDLVESLELFHPHHGVMTLSREQHPDLFDLTCGGFGLTGVILTVTLRLTDLPAAVVQVRKVPVRNLEDAFEQVDALKSHYDFLYTWNNVATFGKHMGRGYVCCGRFSADERGRVRSLPSYRPLPVRDARPRLPKVLHRQVIPWVTRLHFSRQMQRPVEEVDLFDVLYPGMYGAYYYFNLYGPNGFFGHMVLVPGDRWRCYVRKLDRVLRTHREPLIALVIKAFAGRQRLLHFNGTGFSLHAHVPNTPSGRDLIGALEDLSGEFQLIRTIYFDSRLSAATVRSLYPEYDTFKERLHRFDSRRIFGSSLSRRLDL
jgi:decaprenylphospho-beta-D-ribofuranose 2-oxidase